MEVLGGGAVSHERGSPVGAGAAATEGGGRRVLGHATHGVHPHPICQ